MHSEPANQPRLWRQALLLALFLVSVAGQQAWALDQTSHTLYLENDLINGNDSNYTNGIKYSIISADLPSQAGKGFIPRQVMDQLYRLPCFKSDAAYTHNTEFALGQNMYTPADITRDDLIIDDRPYAGWTYLGFGYHRRGHTDGRIRFMDTVELQLGIIGPESFTEDLQKFAHKLSDTQEPNGWDHQLKNEPGLVLAFERKWLFQPDRPTLINLDFIPHAGAVAGNVFTYLNGGGKFRLGHNLDGTFGVSLIRPAGSTQLNYFEKPSIYLFVAANGQWSIRNIFLDGNTFTDSHSVAKEPLVLDTAAGLTLGYKNIMLTLTKAQRTEEFENQAGSHEFESLTISCSFPLGGS